MVRVEDFVDALATHKLTQGMEHGEVKQVVRSVASVSQPGYVSYKDTARQLLKAPTVLLIYLKVHQRFTYWEI